MHRVESSVTTGVKKCLSQKTRGCGLRYVTFLHIFPSHHQVHSPETDKRIKNVEKALQKCLLLSHGSTLTVGVPTVSVTL